MRSGIWESLTGFDDGDNDGAWLHRGASWLNRHDGFRSWADNSELFGTSDGDMSWLDSQGNMLSAHANGVVTIHPDDANSTAWFGDLLADNDSSARPGGDRWVS